MGLDFQQNILTLNPSQFLPRIKKSFHKVFDYIKKKRCSFDPLIVSLVSIFLKGQKLFGNFPLLAVSSRLKRKRACRCLPGMVTVAKAGLDGGCSCEGSITRSATYFSLPRVRQGGGWGGWGGGRGMREIYSLSRLEDVISASVEAWGWPSSDLIRPQLSVVPPSPWKRSTRGSVGDPGASCCTAGRIRVGSGFFVPDGNCLLPHHMLWLNTQLSQGNLGSQVEDWLSSFHASVCQFSKVILTGRLFCCFQLISFFLFSQASWVDLQLV